MLSKNIKIRYLISLQILLLTVITVNLPHSAYGAPKKSYSTMISGRVIDEYSGQPLPFASIMIKETKRSTVTNDKGLFELPVSSDAKTLTVSCVGYEKKTISLDSVHGKVLEIAIEPTVQELATVVVKKPKYRKKDNPAVKFAKLLRETSDLNDPYRNPYYNFDKYEKISIALNNTDSADLSKGITKNMPYLVKHIDTSEVTGKPIIVLSLKEKLSTQNYRNTPRTTKETIHAFKHEGLDEFTNAESFQVFLEDVFREVNLYQNDIPLFQYRFVSPLSPIATDFYKFYLTDTVEIDGSKYIALSCYPMNKSTFGFIGHIYVADQDSTMFIKRVEFKIPKEINLNFVDNLYVIQEYERGEDGSRLITLDDLTCELSVFPGTPSINVRRSTRYANHSFDVPDDLSIFDREEKSLLSDGAEDKDSEYWDRNRLTPLSHSEKTLPTLQAELRTSKFYYWSEKILHVLSIGYVKPWHESPFDIGPIMNTLSFNDIEGMRLRLGGVTTTDLSKRVFLGGYAAYGTKDKVWKYSGEASWSFIDKKDNANEFPVRSIKVSHSYDIDRLGQQYSFSTGDNLILSLKRMNDDKAVYRHLSKIIFTWEWSSNLKLSLTASRSRMNPTAWVHFTDGTDHSFGHIDQAGAELQIRFAPGEKFYQTRHSRKRVNFDAPTVMLTHTYKPDGLATGNYGVNKTRLDFTKRFWFSAFGYLDTNIGGAYIWGKSQFFDLISPNANLSYTIQRECYSLINPMEFLLDRYAYWDLTYWANGAIFNYIPLLNRLKIREVFNFKGFYGRLSDKNNPANHSEMLKFPAGANESGMHRGPYMEVSAGLDNILRFFRVDYVWRLSYRNMPYKIDRGGVRVGLHFTF